MMPIRQRAVGRMRGEICSKPCFLGRPIGHRDIAVQDDDVPRPEIVTIIARSWCASGRPEIAEISGSAGRVVVVVSGSGFRARLLAAPRWVVTVRVLSRG